MAQLWRMTSQVLVQVGCSFRFCSPWAQGGFQVTVKPCNDGGGGCRPAVSKGGSDLQWPEALNAVAASWGGLLHWARDGLEQSCSPGPSGQMQFRNWSVNLELLGKGSKWMALENEFPSESFGPFMNSRRALLGSDQ